MFGIGSLMILSVIGYGIWAALAPPTSGKTEEETRDKPISIAASLKETLDWAIYAYDYPSWPIAKELAQCSRQPKVGNNAFCKHMESTLSGRMVYFVNESDVVPRVPPSFEHFGSLVWYKAGGIRRSQPPMLAMRSGAESTEMLPQDDFVEIPEMTEEEFEQSKREMLSPRSSPFSPDEKALMKARLALISDHDIQIYIDRLK